MNSLIEALNSGGSGLLDFAWPMLWQSSLLAAAIFALDLALRRKVRAAVRYTLWLVLLVKLLLPPSLALPTGIAWWLRPTEPAPAPVQMKTMVVTYPDTLIAAPADVEAIKPPAPKLSAGGWALFASICVSVGLFGWLLIRWRHVAREVREAAAAEAELCRTVAEAMELAGWRRPVRVKVTTRTMSPAVCGLFRPVVLLPQALVEKLPASQLRAVLVHELIHLRRGDVWVNCTQALLQVVYWWHPLVWLANARLRRVREEAVDDAVMLALADDADAYAPTLLEVARLAFRRPLASLGLIGILESRSALRQRIERLVNFSAPGRPGLTAMSVLGIAVFTAAAVPMGKAPEAANVKDPDSDLQPIVRNIYQAANPAPAIDHSFAEKLPPSMYERPPLTDAVIGVEAPGTVANPAPSSDVLVFDAVMKQTNVSAGGLEARFVFNLTNVSASTVVISGVATSCGCTVAQLPVTPWMLEPGASGQIPVVLSLAGRHGEVAKTVTVNSDHGAKTLIVKATLPALPVPNPAARANQVRTSERRQVMIDKLKSIRIERVSFDGIPLPEVVRFLAEESRKRDPEKRGLNFLMNPNGASRIDPATGLPQPTAPPMDFASVRITINPALTHVSLEDVLDSAIMTASLPIHFSVEDFAIVISPGAPQERLSTRVYRVAPDAFYAALRQHGFAGTGPSDELQTALTAWLATAGVPMQPPKSVYFNDKEETLLLHATPKELEAVAALIQGTEPLASASRPSILVQKHTEKLQNALSDLTDLLTRYTEQHPAVEQKKAEIEALMDRIAKETEKNTTRILPMTPAPSNRTPAAILVQDGRLLFELGKLDEAEAKLTQALELEPDNKAAQYYLALVKQARDKKLRPSGARPMYPERAQPEARATLISSNPSTPQVNIRFKLFELSEKDNGLLRGLGWTLTNGSPASDSFGLSNSAAGVTGIWTDAQYRRVLRSLEETAGTDVLGEGQVITLSGRQARMEIADEIPALPRRIVLPGTNAPAPAGNSSSLDVIPSVGRDGNSIDLLLSATVKEFVGYDDPGPFAPAHTQGAGLPIPRFRERQFGGRVTVWDGQTAVLVGSIAENPVRVKSKVPVLGDMPLVGRLFRRESTAVQKKNLTVFVTATIIDPSGNRVHRDEDLPFARNSIPPQRSPGTKP